MAATPEAFGSWHTATDGTAHYVLAGKCLCGAKVRDERSSAGSFGQVTGTRDAVVR